jgi:hypothetical protein
VRGMSEVRLRFNRTSNAEVIQHLDVDLPSPRALSPRWECSRRIWRGARESLLAPTGMSAPTSEVSQEVKNKCRARNKCGFYHFIVDAIAGFETVRRCQC